MQSPKPRAVEEVYQQNQCLRKKSRHKYGLPLDPFHEETHDKNAQYGSVK